MGHVWLSFWDRGSCRDTSNSIWSLSWTWTPNFAFELLQSSCYRLLNGMLHIDSRPAQLLPSHPLDPNEPWSQISICTICGCSKIKELELLMEALQIPITSTFRKLARRTFLRRRALGGRDRRGCGDGLGTQSGIWLLYTGQAALLASVGTFHTLLHTG